jgi:hypothetical protein
MLSHPIKGNEHRKKRLPNRPGGFFDRLRLRVLGLALLLTIVAAPSLLPKFSVVDSDVWWHLKVGEEIGSLSTPSSPNPEFCPVPPLIARGYSWIYEVLLSFFHYRFHLMCVAVYGLLPLCWPDSPCEQTHDGGESESLARQLERNLVRRGF